MILPMTLTSDLWINIVHLIITDPMWGNFLDYHVNQIICPFICELSFGTLIEFILYSCAMLVISFILRIHPIIMGNMCAKLFHITQLFGIKLTGFSLWHWPLTSDCQNQIRFILFSNFGKGFQWVIYWIYWCIHTWTRKQQTKPCVMISISTSIF